MLYGSLQTVKEMTVEAEASPSGPTGTRDVTAACLLAMQDVRVQLPLGALCSGRRKAWLIRRFWKPESVGSNPTVLTVARKAKERQVSNRRRGIAP